MTVADDSDASPDDDSGWLKVLDHDVLAPGQVLLVENARLPPGGVLLWLSQGELRAFWNRCAHFGVPLANRPRHLIFRPGETISCNVHYARYDWDTGACISGECVGQRLIAAPVRMLDNGIWLNVSATQW